jgi:hypothetical protein
MPPGLSPHVDRARLCFARLFGRSHRRLSRFRDGRSWRNRGGWQWRTRGGGGKRLSFPITIGWPIGCAEDHDRKDGNGYDGHRADHEHNATPSFP